MLETVTETTDPVVEATEPVVETVSSTTEPVVEAVEPVVDATDPVLQTVTETTDPVVEAADPVLETVTGTTESVTGSTPQLVGTVSSTAETTSGATENLTEAVMALGEGGSPGSGDVVGTPVDMPIVLDQSAGSAEAVAAQSPFPADDSAAESLLPLLDQGEAVAVLGAVGAVAVSAGIARAVCSPSTSVAFTNVRLIPCYASASAHHVAATASSAAERVGRAGDKVRARGVAIPAGIADGFDQAVRGRREDDGSSLADSRLLVQIGMLLGFVYLAFLTVWFWATRLRWPRDIA